MIFSNYFLICLLISLFIKNHVCTYMHRELQKTPLHHQHGSDTHHLLAQLSSIRCISHSLQLPVNPLHHTHHHHHRRRIQLATPPQNQSPSVSKSHQQPRHSFHTPFHSNQLLFPSPVLYIYMYIYIYICVCVYIYMYIYGYMSI